MQFMTSEHQYISRKNEGDRVIVFERGDLVFVFNFHWNNSYSDYRIGCLKPGKYKVRSTNANTAQCLAFSLLNHWSMIYLFKNAALPLVKMDYLISISD